MEVPGLKTSHSSRGTFRACKRKYHWAYRVGIEQERKPKGLRMGSAWSDALEHGREALEVFYRENLKSAPDWEIDQLCYELEVLQALYDTYPYHNNNQREVPFEHHGPGYSDRGQLDGLKSNPFGVVIEENKLYARFGKMEEEKLEFDEQVDSYVAAVVDGEVQDVPATPAAQVRVEYNVSLKPALRQRQGESMEAFGLRCAADIRSRPEHYHRQYHLSRSEEQLEDFRSRRDKHVMDLQYEEQMGVWERSPSACFDYGQCPFLKICRSHEGTEVPEGYRKREERK